MILLLSYRKTPHLTSSKGKVGCIMTLKEFENEYVKAEDKAHSIALTNIVELNMGIKQSPLMTLHKNYMWLTLATPLQWGKLRKPYNKLARVQPIVVNNT